jgi:hypothetical protein
MLRFVSLLSRTKDEANQLIPGCAVGVDTESSVWIMHDKTLNRLGFSILREIASVWIMHYRPHYFIV